MFGPSKPMHHREPSYRTLLADVEEQFRRTFTIPRSHTILFVMGSGTHAIDCVLASIAVAVRVDEASRPFAARIMEQAKALDRYTYRSVHRWVVQYDTAHAQPTGVPFHSREGGSLFVDAISAFPYYDYPSEADVWVTVSSKQLMGSPVVSIVVLNERATRWAMLPVPNRIESLNLARYIDARQDAESPHTPMIPQLVDLLDMLETWPGIDVHRRTIDERREVLTNAAPGPVVGEGPVATLAFDLPPAFVREWGLYVTHANVAQGEAQIFLWGDERDEIAFSKFCQELTTL